MGGYTDGAPIDVIATQGRRDSPSAVSELRRPAFRVGSMYPRSAASRRGPSRPHIPMTVHRPRLLHVRRVNQNRTPGKPPYPQCKPPLPVGKLPLRKPEIGGVCHDRTRADRYGCRRRRAPAESGHGGRAQSRDDHQVRSADAGDHLPVAAAGTAVGPGVRRRVPGQPPPDLYTRGRAPHVHHHRIRGPGRSARTQRAARPARFRRRGARRARGPLRPTGVRRRGRPGGGWSGRRPGVPDRARQGRQVRPRGVR